MGELPSRPIHIHFGGMAKELQLLDIAIVRNSFVARADIPGCWDLQNSRAVRLQTTVRGNFRDQIPLLDKHQMQRERKAQLFVLTSRCRAAC